MADAREARRKVALASRYPRLAPAVSRESSVASQSAGALGLGHDLTGAEVRLAVRPRLEHMHVVGATGSGKTTLLERMIRQDIAAGRGVCVIDPDGNHPGSLFKRLQRQLFDAGFHKTGKVHVINPNARSHIVGMNFLAPIPGVAASVLSDALLEAFQQVWKQDFHDFPTTRTVLKATFMTLVDAGLTLGDAKHLYDPHDKHGARRSTISKLNNEYAREELERLHETSEDDKSKRDFRAEIVGPINRLNDFLSSDAIREMVSHPAPLDLRRIMDDGDVLLVNLSEGDAISEADASLLGTLLMRYFFLLARKRTHSAPFFIYADECHRFLSGDVPKMLAQSRKYGVGAVLAHQFLGQLREAGGEVMCQAVRNSTEVKAVFRVKSQEEGEELAQAVMTLDLEMPVQALIRPAAVAQEVMQFKGRGSSKSEITAMAEAISRGLADTVGESSSTAMGNIASEGMTQMLPGDPSHVGGWLSLPLAMSHSLSASSGLSEMTSSSSMRALTTTLARTISNSLGRGASMSESVHEGLRTVYKDLVSAVHSKENVLYMAGLAIRRLPVGAAFLSVRDQATRITVPEPKP